VTNSNNSTNTTNDVNALATNLFGSSVATSVTQKDVNNYLALAIIGTVIAVSFEPNMFQIRDYYSGFLLLIERLNFYFFYNSVYIHQ
jgi:hypothetical protein